MTNDYENGSSGLLTLVYHLWAHGTKQREQCAQASLTIGGFGLSAGGDMQEMFPRFRVAF